MRPQNRVQRNKTLRFLPNALSALRLVLSVFIFTTEAFTAPFYALYLAAGVTDLFDGYLARCFSAESVFGARLDSLADFVFTFVVLYCVIPAIMLPRWAWLWIAVIVLIRVCTLAVGLCRFSQAAFLHTLLNKLTGLLLFFGVPLLGVLPNAPMLAACCALAMLASVEELILLCRMPALDRDIKGFFFDNKSAL